MILLTMGALVAPAPAGASAGTHALSDVLPGNGYVATKVDWTGVGDVKLELEYTSSSEGVSFGVAYVKPDGSTWSATFILSGLLGGPDCLFVRTDAAGTIQGPCEPSAAQQVVFPASEGSLGSVALILSEDLGDPAGIWTLVAWHAYHVDAQHAGPWTLDLDPDHGEVLDWTTGDRAFFGRSSDFRDGQAIAASAAGAFAAVNVNTHFAFSIKDTLFGIVTPDTVTRRSPGMVLHGPLGAETCACTFLSPLPTARAAPGDYIVELTRATGGHQGFMEAVVFAMDLRLPS